MSTQTPNSLMRVATTALSLLVTVAANAQYDSHDAWVPSPRYSSTNQTQYDNGQVMSFFDVFFDTRQDPGPPGSPPIHSFFDITYRIELSPGSSQNGTGKILPYIERRANNESFFDVFIEQMDFLNLPAVQVRESPTKVSVGQMIIDPIPGTNDFRVSSFFDIFTELSIDGGQTWSPALDSTHMVGAPVPEPATMLVLGLGAIGVWRRRVRAASR